MIARLTCPTGQSFGHVTPPKLGFRIRSRIAESTPRGGFFGPVGSGGQVGALTTPACLVDRPWRGDLAPAPTPWEGVYRGPPPQGRISQNWPSGGGGGVPYIYTPVPCSFARKFMGVQPGPKTRFLVKTRPGGPKKSEFF